jgi:hypothetical protein
MPGGGNFFPCFFSTLEETERQWGVCGKERKESAKGGKTVPLLLSRVM